MAINLILKKVLKKLKYNICIKSYINIQNN